MLRSGGALGWEFGRWRSGQACIQKRGGLWAQGDQP